MVHAQYPRPAAYVEIQGGPISDQSIKLELRPGEKKNHVEYWIPTDHPLDIYSLKVPALRLRPIDRIPLFDWARKNESSIWIALADAYKNKSMPSRPPLSGRRAVGSIRHGRSGRCFSLGDPNISPVGTGLLAIPLWDLVGWKRTCRGGDRTTIHPGYRSGKSFIGKAICSSAGVGKGERYLRRYPRDSWLNLHPQLVIERDKVLKKFGTEALSEREKWLDKINASSDEWVVERKVQLLIDKKQYQEAKDLLLSTHFQKVHQTYTRTGLWEQINEGLGLSPQPVPEQLGEDRLARFGAYREYE
mgnify:CR=1 FL=1